MMAKLLKWALIPVVIIGVMIFLASRVGEQPLTPQSEPVAPSALIK